MTISSTPPITRSTPVAGPRERPISPMDAHRAMKTALNPATKLTAFANAADLDTCRGFPPTSCPMNAGTIGKKHGEAKETRPASSASGIVTSISAARCGRTRRGPEPLEVGGGSLR